MCELKQRLFSKKY